MLFLLVRAITCDLFEREPIRVCTGNMGSDMLNNPGTETFFAGSVIRGGDCVFQTKIVVIGAQGAGKSSLANSFLGWDRTFRGLVPFAMGHGVQAGTLSSSYASGAWIGKHGSPGVTVVDTPGFNSSIQQMEEMIWTLAQLEEVNMFVLVFRYKDRMSSELANSLKSVGHLLGDIYNNLAVVVSFWSFSEIDEADRKNRNVNRRRYSNQIGGMIKDVLGTQVKVPVFFVDSHYKKSNIHERREFNKEASKLWSFLSDVPPWVSLPPSKLKAKVQRVRRRTGEIKEKCQVYEEDRHAWLNKVRHNQNIIKHQDDVIMLTRNSIEEMKNNCASFK